MDEAEFKRRTKRLALLVIALVDELPSTQSARAIGNQLIRSGTSVGSNYRAACCGRSAADMVSKLGIVIEEADETMYWCELLVESGLMPVERLREIHQSAKEILAMTIASKKTMKRPAPKLKI